MRSAPITPIAVSDRRAAQMLDMPTSRFRELVAAGALPKPRRIADMERWRMVDLEAVLSGTAAWPDDEDIEA